jgi:glycerol-3-phosphate dehydrogenase
MGHTQGIPTTVLVRRAEHAEHMNTHRKHPQHLSDMTLDDHITARADPQARGVAVICFGERVLAVCLSCPS